jgi:TolB-like protein
MKRLGMVKYGRWLILPTLLAALTAGCGGTSRDFTATDFPPEGKFRIAVLPLTNLSGDPAAAEIVGNALTVEVLANGSFEVVHPALVNSSLAELRIRYADRMNSQQLEQLGKKLDVAGVLVGTVGAYEYRHLEGTDYPHVSIHARILRVPDGKILWAADHSRLGNDREFILGLGLVSSLTQLAQRVAQEMIDSL